jgi:NHLM bacteriocin system ABC transporter ATP-binding protein
VSSLLSALVSAAAWILLFVYSPLLALVATAVALVNAAFTGASAALSLQYARAHQEAKGRLSGLALQLLTGVAKLRVSGSEARAFARWAREFRSQREMAFRVGRFGTRVRVFNSVLSIASTMAIYWAYAALADGGAGITTGRFLAFSAAFGSFMAASMSVTATAIELFALVPTWERARPILDETPEADPARPDPGELTGRIEVSHLDFRYRADGPLILNDVSLHAEPGEFVALVGPSGAGKSTLLRILLAFDLPDTSSVYYDGHDLATIDVTAVRRQIGVVLQSSRLTAGDIYTNIVGASALPVEAAWEAARMAGLEDDLREMPMGLHTVVSEGGGALSGGQRQRLLIARALVHRPRVLFFDEATSALGNRTQRIVSESIASLHATRVVIAHRLSTIQNADRIYVMDGGRVVQVGTFQELMSRPGLFADLAARQEA